MIIKKDKYNVPYNMEEWAHVVHQPSACGDALVENILNGPSMFAMPMFLQIQRRPHNAFFVVTLVSHPPSRTRRSSSSIHTSCWFLDPNSTSFMVGRLVWQWSYSLWCISWWWRTWLWFVALCVGLFCKMQGLCCSFFISEGPYVHYNSTVYNRGF